MTAVPEMVNRPRFGGKVGDSELTRSVQPPPPEASVNALVIDDSQAMRSILRKMLGEFGFDVTEAADGREALEQMAGDLKFDVALVDWNMPEMDGYDFVRAVRADHDYDGVLLMMVTTETEMEQVVRALSVGANEYVMKPFTKEVILEKLDILQLVDASTCRESES